MIKKFYCHICKLSFSSGYALADHFRSDEHRDKAVMGNLDLLIEKFVSDVRANIHSDKGEIK